MTRATDLTTVGDGLPLGCLAMKIPEIPAAKWKLEAAFEHAWTAWEGRETFPSIKSGLDRNDIMVLINNADRRPNSRLFWNQVGAHHEPRFRRERDQIDDVQHALRATSGIRLDQWTSLAMLFANELGTPPWPSK